ncbi:hypothetical protein [Clostridium grantii]|uniref:Uncharacterized membrane-anchored protein n=1 Tax=Clostridium grantii DSM 8605 TaxID=1121316 RepID=A0A1M5WX32_9CLOT|nr:hypothetical protein [Clostridium grantii]SHH92265.1 Uncharacterized membrane-anchored protein [Clostridium grantii DSM 8605]
MNKQTTMKKMLNKVPQITIFFWIIKVLCTTVGETFSDFLSVNMGFGLVGTAVAMGVVLAIVLYFQFKKTKYVPSVYWLSVVLISVFGTLVTDYFTDEIGVPLEFSTIFFSIALVITFAVWYRSEKTLSIHSIFTTKRESFYWLSIFFTFALGTASGDLMAEALGLGYLVTGLIICGVIISVSIAWKFGLNSILSFWIIYIMTRPLGASIGDLLSQTHENGGLGFGATITSIIFLLAIVVTIIFLTLTKKDLIVKPIVETNSKGNTFVQVAIVLSLFLVVSVAGYIMRTSTLAEEARASAPMGLTSQELMDFVAIEQDTLAYVVNNDMPSAKERAKDLETKWDQSAARLKAIDSNKWTTIDDSIDVVLSDVRTKNPDASTCQTDINESLDLMK